MTNLNVPAILHRLVRRFGLLLLLTAVGGLAGGVYDAVKTPTYIAKSYVVVTAAQGDSPTAVNFAQAYGRIATSGPVIALATAALGSGQGLDQVTASTSPDAPVIEITATGAAAARAADAANAVAQALVSYGSTHADATRVTLSVLARAGVPASPASPKPPLEVAVGAAGGLLIGALAALAGAGAPRPGRRDEPARPAVAFIERPAPVRARTLAWYAAAGSIGEPEAGERTVAIPAPAGRARVPVRAAASVATDVVEPTEILRPAVGRAIVIYREGS